MYWDTEKHLVILETGINSIKLFVLVSLFSLDSTNGLKQFRFII